HILELVVGGLPESLHGLVEIRLGFSELELGSRPEGSRPVRTPLGQAQRADAELAAGQAAQEIEPGEVGVRLEAALHTGLRRFEPRGLDITVGHQALGPEEVGLEPQGGLELLDRLGESLALVLLLPAQEVIEGCLGAGTLRLSELPSLPGPILSPRQAGRSPQVVSAGVLGPQTVGTLQDPQ